MHCRLSTYICCVALLLATAPANSATNIDPVYKYSYGANIGWFDWTGDGSTGALFSENYATGWIYSANCGWIRLSSGAPANRLSFSNTSANDWGVNIDAVSDPGNYLLSGYAYSANIGWINFNVVDQTGESQRPRISKTTGILLGYAWSPNCGWISLDGGTFAYVQVQDFINLFSWQLRDYLLGKIDLTISQLAEADANGDGDIDIADVIQLVAAGL